MAAYPGASPRYWWLIIAIWGSASKLPRGHKVSLEVLLGYTGSGADEKRSSPVMGEIQPYCRLLSALFTRQKWKILLEQFSILVLPPPSPRELLPRQTLHPSAAKAMQISRACEAAGWSGKEEGWPQKGFYHLVGQGSWPSSSALLTWYPPDVMGGEVVLEVALDSQAPPLAFLIRTPLGIMAILA